MAKVVSTIELPLSALLEKNGAEKVWIVDEKTSSVSCARYQGRRQGRRLLHRRRGARSRDARRHRRRPQPDRRPESQDLAKGGRMKGFNLSDWALNHRSLVWYFMLVFVVAGVFSYLNLGREEDPAFTIKTMIIQAQLAGRLGRRDLTPGHRPYREEARGAGHPRLHPQSSPLPGKTVDLRQPEGHDQGARRPRRSGSRSATWSTTSAAQFPHGVRGPFFNDRFGDVYGNIYAFTADGLTPAPVARLCRGCPRPDPDRAEYRQGRPHRRAGRGDLSRILDPPDRGARPQPAGDRGQRCRRRTPSRRPASSRPGRSASACASAASSPRKTACAPSTCGSTTASSG